MKTIITSNKLVQALFIVFNHIHTCDTETETEEIALQRYAMPVPDRQSHGRSFIYEMRTLVPVVPSCNQRLIALIDF